MLFGPGDEDEDEGTGTEGGEGNEDGGESSESDGDAEGDDDDSDGDEGDGEGDGDGDGDGEGDDEGDGEDGEAEKAAAKKAAAKKKASKKKAAKKKPAAKKPQGISMAAAKRMAKEAARAAVDEVKADTDKSKKRKKMTESARLTAEKDEETTRADAAEKDRDEKNVELEFYKAMTGLAPALANPNSSAFIKAEALQKVADEECDTMEEAIEAVIEENKYLLKTEKTGDSDDDDDDGPPKKKKANTAAKGKKGTESPSKGKPEKAVDSFDLSPQAFRKRMSEVHGVH